MTSTDLMKPAVGGKTAVKFDAANNMFLQRTAEAGVTDGTYARFNGNTGQFVTNGPEIEPGSEVIFDLYHCKLSWQGFDKDNKPHRGPEVPFNSQTPLPDPSDKNPDIRWGKVIKIGILTTDGTQMLYTAKADKPTREVWRLLKRYGAEIMKNRDADGNVMVPVIRMSIRSFQIEVPDDKDPTRKIKATKFSEEFNIVGWVSQDDVAALIGGDAAPDAEPETVTGVQEVLPPLPPASKAPETAKTMPFTRRKPA